MYFYALTKTTVGDTLSYLWLDGERAKKILRKTPSGLTTRKLEFFTAYPVTQITRAITTILKTTAAETTTILATY